MRTFEERYTAWIDGKLEGPALTSFELELSRRAAAGEARADKDDAAWLHLLLSTHLKAPAMTNAEFFSHQLRERIEAERVTGRRREEARQSRNSLFRWPFVRLAGFSAAFLFVATALYYGMMPSHPATPTAPIVAEVTPTPRNLPTDPPPGATESLAEKPPARRPSDGILALASPTPPLDLNAEIQVVKVPGASASTSATALQYKDPNVNVLWINGLDYMPSVPGKSPASPAPAPAASANP